MNRAPWGGFGECSSAYAIWSSDTISSSRMTSTKPEACLPVICIDAGHARAVLKMQINKSDRNDAAGIARIMQSRLV